MFLRIKPITKGRPRLGRRRKAYTPAATLEYEAKVREAWEEIMDEQPFEGPVGVSVDIGTDFIEVEVWELEESHRPKHIRGDLDNYFKSIADALNTVAYVDDRQIHYMDVRFTKDER